MPWLRLDDKFTRNRKVAALSDREFRVHMRVLCYCAEFKTGGNLPLGVWSEVAGLTRAIGRKFVSLGLWDDEDGFLSVHDWHQYNPPDPTGAARQARYRERHRSNTSRNGGDNGKSNAAVTAEVTSRSREAGTPAQSRTPVPSITTSAAGSKRGTAADNGLVSDLQALGWKEWQVQAGSQEPAKARSWLEKARKEATSNLGGYAWRGFTSGDEAQVDLGRYTGCKQTKGTHGTGYRRDPLGMAKPPSDWPYQPPSRQEIEAALGVKAT